MKKLMKFTLILAAVSLAACSDKSKPNVELIQDFMETPAVKAQEYDENSPNHSGMRVPPDNTVPRGFQPYAYANDFEGAKANKNPFAGQMESEILIVGQKYYNTNCLVCHGANGEGAEKSSVSQFMALKPPTLLSDKVKGWTDGHLYHVITMGQGVMGPYASHIPNHYRWQVVNYIRFLQNKANK